MSMISEYQEQVEPCDKRREPSPSLAYRKKRMSSRSTEDFKRRKYFTDLGPNHPFTESNISEWVDAKPPTVYKTDGGSGVDLNQDRRPFKLAPDALRLVRENLPFGCIPIQPKDGCPIVIKDLKAVEEDYIPLKLIPSSSMDEEEIDSQNTTSEPKFRFLLESGNLIFEGDEGADKVETSNVRRFPKIQPQPRKRAWVSLFPGPTDFRLGWNYQGYVSTLWDTLIVSETIKRLPDRKGDIRDLFFQRVVDYTNDLDIKAMSDANARALCRRAICTLMDRGRYPRSHPLCIEFGDSITGQSECPDTIYTNIQNLLLLAHMLGLFKQTPKVEGNYHFRGGGCAFI